LNDLAAAGETLVSESIHAAVADEVESEARGATAVAGLPEPVGVWCIRAVGAARAADRPAPRAQAIRRRAGGLPRRRHRPDNPAARRGRHRQDPAAGGGNQQKQALVAELVRRVSGQRPILLAVEDIHWAAPITLQHLAGLCRVAAECPAILLLTTRIE